MAQSKANKAYTLRMTKQAQKPAKNDKPSQRKTKPNYTFGGNFATGRQIKTQPLTAAEKKKKMSSTVQVGGRVLI